MSDDTYMRNIKSGEIHRVSNGRSREECNLDAARDIGALEVLDEHDALLLVASAPEQRCGHCWPEADDADHA